MSSDIVSGEESNDMLINHPDIEEIDNKLRAKRKKKNSHSPKQNKQNCMIAEMIKSPQIKIVLKDYEQFKDEQETKQVKKKITKDVPVSQQKELKKVQNKLPQVEKELLKKQKKEQKRLIEEEKKAKQEKRQLMKKLAEEEKRLKALQRQEQQQQKEKEERLTRELKYAMKEEKLEEKRLANEQRLEERRIAEEERKRMREELKVERIEKKRQLEEEAALKRREKAMKGMKYLLSVSEKYSDFYKGKLTAALKPVKQTSGKPLQERNKFLPTIDDMKEAAEVQKDATDLKKEVDITQQLKYFENGKLHPYQVEGVTWLKVLFDNGINGILADEMGLGKTVQVIALICHLLEIGVPGPYLIIVPLSTLPNWKLEFERFAPKVPTVVFHGSKFERKHLYTTITKKYTIGDMKTLPVILVSYQTPIAEQNFFKRLQYQYVVVDEGHRIKNHETKLSEALRTLNCANRLLLTGTPLQNNITELWSLLNFLMPHLFTNMDTFSSFLMLEDMQDENKLIEQEQKNSLLNTLHRVLSPFMLRRLKKEVLTDLVPKKDVIIYCPISKLQRMLYSSVIEKNLQSLLMIEDEQVTDLNEPLAKRKCSLQKKPYYCYDDVSDDDFSDYEELVSVNDLSQPQKKKFKPFIVSLTMLTPMIMFRKIVDHPYLVHFPLDPNSQQKRLLVNEDLITTSGKMMVLDVLLEKLQQRGHKVLIFSTLVMTLDLIEEMLILRNHKYCRIDGGHNLKERGESIEEFNKDPTILAFLLSTRAGGLGLNLTGADTCIFFDRDWNPQADIQAEARCHRIGQTRPVMVYTLVLKNTIDEKIITCGYQKRLLEKLVIKDGKFTNLPEEDQFKTENYLKELKELLNNDVGRPFEEEFSNKELDKLLDRTELYESMKKLNIKK